MPELRGQHQEGLRCVWIPIRGRQGDETKVIPDEQENGCEGERHLFLQPRFLLLIFGLVQYGVYIYELNPD